MGSPRRITTEPQAALTRFKSFDASSRTSLATLTYPITDYDGDFIQPDGGDWTGHETNPVNWEHEIPVARGTVEYKSARIDGKEWVLPIGKAKFFETAKDTQGLDLVYRDDAGKAVRSFPVRDCLDAADDACRLVADDVVNGVSLEFLPLGTEGVDFYPTGKKSLLRGMRPAMHFERWQGLTWAYALQQKNPGAMTLAVEKAFRLAETGKHPGGKVVSPLILKSFAPLKSLKRPAAVRGGYSPETPAMATVKKAYGDDEDPLGGEGGPMDSIDDSNPVDAVEPPADPDLTGDDLPNMKPTPMLFSMAVQGMKDIAANLKAGIDGGAEHVEGIARLQTVVDEINSIAEELLADGRKMFPDAGLDAPDDTAEGDAAMPMADDGALMAKAFKKGFPIRFKASELKPVQEVKIEPKPDPSEGRRMRQLNRELQTLMKQVTN